MDDSELTLIAQLSFMRSDLECFVFSVLGSIGKDFRTVAWPDNEAELGHQLVALGRALQWHAALGALPSTVDNSQPDP